MSDRFFDFGNRLYNDGDGVYRHMVRCDELAPSGHEYFFRFLSYDLSGFRNLVEGYTQDLATGDAEGEPVPDGEDSLFRAARDIHPLFGNKDDARSFIIKSIIEYARSIKRLPTVMQSLTSGQGTVLKPAEAGAFIAEAGTTVHPYRGSIYFLIEAQAKFRRAVTVLLDESVSLLSPMTRAGREAVYAAFFGRGEGYDGMSVTIGLSLSPSPQAKRLQAWLDFAPGGLGKAENMLREALYHDSRPEWTSVLDEIGNDELPSILLTYRVNSLEDVLDTELFDMLRDGTKIGRCRTCGRFFAFDQENVEYCTIEEDGKNCLRTYRETLTKGLYWKAYKTHNQRLSRGRCTEEEFRAWKAEASAARDMLLCREISLKEYKEILKK